MSPSLTILRRASLAAWRGQVRPQAQECQGAQCVQWPPPHRDLPRSSGGRDSCGWFFFFSDPNLLFQSRTPASNPVGRRPEAAATTPKPIQAEGALARARTILLEAARDAAPACVPMRLRPQSLIRPWPTACFPLLFEMPIVGCVSLRLLW